MKKIIEINKIYHLDVGSSAPIEIKTLYFTKNGVMCEYLSSWKGREETVDYDLFKINGFEIK